MKLFGDQSEEATNNELPQIQYFGTYIPMDKKSLSRVEKMKSIYSLKFIVEKRDVRVKAQKCAVGSKQNNFRVYVKSDWAYPMVTPDGVIIMSTIEAHEGCDIVVTDIPNAFLNTNYSEKLSCF